MTSNQVKATANTPAKAASRCSVPELPRIPIVKVLAWSKE